MEHIANRLPNLKGQTLQSNGDLPKFEQQRQQQAKLHQLQALLAQSYDVFHVYGKQPEALENILQAFWLVLRDATVEDIHAAFGEWLRSQERFPTPANIRKLCDEYVQRRKLDMAAKTMVPARAVPRKEPGPPAWTGKTFQQMTPETRIDLRNFLATIPPTFRDAYILDNRWPEWGGRAWTIVG